MPGWNRARARMAVGARIHARRQDSCILRAGVGTAFPEDAVNWLAGMGCDALLNDDRTELHVRRIKREA